jgi:hypothetical protein
MIAPRWCSRKRSRRWPASLLACLMALGGSAGIAGAASPAPDAAAQASSAPAATGSAATASHAAGTAAGAGSAANRAKPKPAVPATKGKPKQKPKAKTQQKSTQVQPQKNQPPADKPADSGTSTVQNTQLEACDDKGREVEVVNLTFFYSTVGGTGDTPQAKYTMSFADALNSLFQVSVAHPGKVQAAERQPAKPVCPLVQNLGYGRLLLHGTPEQNIAIKRAMAAFDVPWPQVRLNMWAVQVSGTGDQALSRKVKCIHDQIAWTRDAIVRVENRLKKELMKELIAGWRPCTCLPDDLQERIDIWLQGPMSLNGALILLVLHDGEGQARIIDNLRAFAKCELGKPQLDPYCGPAPAEDQETTVCSSRPAPPPPQREHFRRLREAAEMAWLTVAAEPVASRADLCTTFKHFWQSYWAVRKLAGVELPQTCDAATKCTEISAQESLLNDLARSRNRIDRVLRSIMDAYAADMEDLLFDPLLEAIRNKEKQSTDSGGVAVVGRTRIVVTSGLEAEMSPEMASYVETTRPKSFGADLLKAAFPAKKSDGSAAGLERIVGGIPQAQAALLAAALLSDTEPRYVKVAPGIGVDVRPVVLPDESEARLTIDARFGVDANELSTAKRDDLWTQPPPASIKSHHITTDATVGVFDLLDLSSFSIDTLTPQAPYYIPILGRLPILGPAFQLPRKNKAVRHESVILVNTVVLPRSTLLTDPF